jgi:hypothetical protein
VKVLALMDEATLVTDEAADAARSTDGALQFLLGLPDTAEVKLALRAASGAATERMVECGKDPTDWTEALLNGIMAGVELGVAAERLRGRS